MRRIPIRMKLAGVLALPLFALFVMTVVEVRELSREVDAIAGQTDLARAATGHNSLITRLQDERSWPAAELVGSADVVTLPVEDYDESRQLTDEAIADFQAGLGDQGDEAAAAFAPAFEALAELDQIRADIDANRASSPDHGDQANIAFTNDIYRRYTALLPPILDATDRVARTIDDPDLRRGAELVSRTTRQITVYVELGRTVVVTPTSMGGFTSLETTRPAIELVERWNAGNAVLRSAEAPFDAVVADHFPEESATALTELADRAIGGEEIEYLDLIAPLEAPGAGGLVEFRTALNDANEARAATLHDEARGRERLFWMLAGVTLLATLALTWLVSRSITAPLRSLTLQAQAMATEGLPAAVDDVLRTPLGDDVRGPRVAPVTVRTRDEVADVADALNTVQETALDLAVEQAMLRRNVADSFVNLGRRNQNLIVRQLDFITQLEQGETDPQALSDLFRLDHLATRMRRNAESLLVLAGIEPPRQWAAPVQLVDVVRAAVGEVEDYQRVSLGETEPATVLGSAAADLAHLLAELIENALVSSPPERPVVVRGRHRHDGGYSLAVIDAGVGMDAEALDAANRRLVGMERFTTAPSRYLGHYVAGNLAARHGIHVHLTPGPAGIGITAAIELPPEMVTTPEPGPGPGEIPPAPPADRALGHGHASVPPAPDVR